MTDEQTATAAPPERTKQLDYVPVPYERGMHSIEMAPAAWQIAYRLADTDFVPRALRGNQGAVMACIMFGHELGIEPMQALQKIHVVEGRPALAAELMRALVQRSGHTVRIEEMSSTSVTVMGQRKGEDWSTRVTWTIDDARKAGLADKNNWRKYPLDMLVARATGRLCRALFADCLAGLSYTIEELTDGDVIDVDDIGVVARAVTAGDAPAPVAGGTAVQSRHRASPRRSKQAAAPAAETTPSPVAPKPPLPGEGETAADDVAEGEVVGPNLTEDDPDDLEGDIIDPPDSSDDTERPPESPQAPEPPLPGTVPTSPVDDMNGPRLTGPQMLAMKFGRKGITDRAIRLKMTSELIGRDIESSSQLTPAEIGIVSDALDDVSDTPIVESDPAAEADAAPEVRSGPSEPPPRPQGPPPEEWTGDQWRALIHSRGVKAAVLLKKARELSGGSVPTLDNIAGLGIADDLVGFVEDAAT